MAKKKQNKRKTASNPGKTAEKRATAGKPTRKKATSKKSTPAAASKRSKTAKGSAPAAGRPAASAAPHFPVVGIGASAGGLEAFKAFVKATPTDSGMALVLIQHLDPTHQSFTVELLAKHTGMPVVAVEDDMLVEANHVYVIPPNAYLSISGEKLNLTEPVEQRGMRLPIDFFFRSLAEDQQQRAICIILSGTGTDGTLGLREVKASGGVVMVQDPDSAQFDGMPRSAIATGLVDYILPIDKMPATLDKYVRHWYVNGAIAPPQVAERAPDQLQTILSLLRARAKSDFSCYKKATLTRRIYRRMGLAHLENMADYVQYLRDHKEEVTALCKDLLITVTNFYRDPDAWSTLEKKVVAPLVREHDVETPIRVWVPGCATGEEAYSIAMLLLEQMVKLEKVCDIQIFASDIDQDALAVARAGVYPENIAADVSPDRLRQFFVKGEHTYRINKEIRDAVVFAEQNVISDPPFSKLDMISCRNLLIYLEGDAQKRIFSLIHFSLNEGGYLFLGNSETIAQQQDLFESVSKKWRIYRRIGPVRHDRPDLAFTASDRHAPKLATPPVRPATGRLAPLAEQIVLQRYSPACALINRKTEVLYVNGPIDQYLQVPVGEPNQNLWALAREGLRTKLRTTVHQAIRSNDLLALGGLRVKRGKTYCPVRVTVEPLSTPREAEGLLLVLFEEDDAGTADSAVRAETPPAAQRPVDAESIVAANDEATIRQLEDELHSTRDDLQSTIEELETSNEEFKAANEEAMSINEELQSTNEELETSKEELQSLNEELSTVNNQLEQKYSELEVTTNDLNNLLTSTDVATVFLDRRFCLKRFTPATTQLLRVIPTDIGRPLSDLARRFIDPHLMVDAECVLDRLAQIEKEIQSDDGRWYIRRARPYRTEDNRIDGVVITFTDITDRKTAELKIQTARTYAEGIVETVREPLVILNNQLRVQSCNRAFYESFDVSPKETEGRMIYELSNGQWDIPQFRTLMDEILPREKRLSNFEVVHDFQHLGQRNLLLNARAIARADGADELILLAIEDVTERKRAEQQLNSLNAELERRVTERTAELERVSKDQGQLAALVEASSTAMIGLRMDGTISAWNPAAEQLFGYPAAEAVEQNIQVLVPPQRSYEFTELLSRLEQGEAVRDYETVRLHKDGTPIDVALTVSLLKDNEGRVIGKASIIRDLRDQKQMEQQMAELADEERQRLGRELHDSLGQQITAVGMVASALREQCSDELPQAELLAKLEANVEAAKQQLRFVAKGLFPVDVDASGLSVALTELANQTRETHQVDCLFECPEEVPLHDNFTATQMFLVAREAVHNAVKHAQPRNIVIRLNNHDGVRLSVRDDGAGSHHDMQDSEGMGLRIMRHRCSLIGGSLTIQTPADGGTMLTCYLQKESDRGKN